jgi:hypothetical protein
MTSGAESWTMNIDIAKWLAAFEKKKVLRKICGVIRANDNWKKQYNKE